MHSFIAQGRQSRQEGRTGKQASVDKLIRGSESELVYAALAGDPGELLLSHIEIKDDSLDRKEKQLGRAGDSVREVGSLHRCKLSCVGQAEEIFSVEEAYLSARTVGRYQELGVILYEEFLDMAVDVSSFEETW